LNVYRKKAKRQSARAPDQFGTGIEFALSRTTGRSSNGPDNPPGEWLAERAKELNIMRRSQTDRK
jgi:hypothetical protein